MTHVELFTGGRKFADVEHARRVIDELHRRTRAAGIALEIVEGGAPGADWLVGKLARQREITLHEFPADWDRWGKPAGHRRNRQMLDYLLSRREAGATVGVTAFPGGPGTAGMVRIARAAGVRVVLV